jgi:hypothetical protein
MEQSPVTHTKSLLPKRTSGGVSQYSHEGLSLGNFNSMTALLNTSQSHMWHTRLIQSSCYSRLTYPDSVLPPAATPGKDHVYEHGKHLKSAWEQILAFPLGSLSPWESHLPFPGFLIPKVCSFLGTKDNRLECHEN